MENNFKTIKESVTKIIFESYNTENAELTSLYQNFLNEMKQSPILKTLYIVYNNIEHNKFSDKDTAEIFLNENLFSFGTFSKNDIINENKKIGSLLKEHLTISENDELFDLILESSKDRKLSNLNKKAIIFNKIAQGLVKEEEIIKPEIPVIDPATINKAFEYLNEDYSYFNDTEKDILKAFINKDEDAKENLYQGLVNENIKLVKRKLYINEDEELEASLILTEEKLKTMEYSTNTQIGEYAKLLDLQSDLK